MLKYLPMAPFALSILLVACTARGDPVADNAVAPPDSLVGDESAQGLAAPANAAAAEAVRQAALPPATGGLAWRVDPSGDGAAFGPPGAGPALSIRCASDGGRPKLVFTRHSPAPQGAAGTLSFTGNGVAASLPAHGDRGDRSSWSAAVAPGDMARDIAKAFDGDAPVHIGIGGTPPLVVPAGPPAAIIRDCLSA
jgi:hypothetical protein